MQIPDYIEVRNAIGQTVGYLSPEADGAKNAWIDQQLNAECILEFSLPLISEKWSLITPECRFVVGNREFVILRPDTVEIERDQQGKTWGKVTAQESWVLLDKKYVTISNDPQNPTPPELTVIIVSGGQPSGEFSPGSAGSALSYLLQSSGWQVDTVDVTGTHDLETEKESLLANIKKVQEIWGGYIVWDSLNKTVSFRAEATWQNCTGFQVRYAKNLKSITRTANYDIITRLYPFGENDLDISSVNGGVKYIDDFSYTTNVYVGVYQNQEITGAQELKDKAIEVLSKICKPCYTYRVNTVDLRLLPEYSHENFALGDMVEVIDEELGIDVEVRIVRYKYNIFKPWQCELEIGEPEERLAEKLRASFDVAGFISDVLKPNTTASNLLKGFISTFTTLINSANGKLVWNDDTLEAIEINEGGQETGKRVRITPGGIGISTDFGQTFNVAMTGEGILANRIIVSELYVLATDDGFTKLMADGLHVFDESVVERLVAGWWMDGPTKRFGLKVKASDGSTILLDDQGSLQTYQDGRADNVDGTHSLPLHVYLPSETRSIKKALLRFKLLAFRAYETGAASGGGSTSGPSSASTTVSGYENIEVTNYIFDTGYLVDYTDSEYADADTHNHGIADGTQLLKNGGGYVTYYVFNGESHVHWLHPHHHSYNAYGHSHGMNHTHQIYDHIHGLNFGIYEGTAATGVTVKINGIDRTAALGGPFNTDQNGLNISQYMVAGQWNIIELGSTQKGRIDATVFLQTLMGV